jgi:hypothetical protein
MNSLYFLTLVTVIVAVAIIYLDYEQRYDQDVAPDPLLPMLAFLSVVMVLLLMVVIIVRVPNPLYNALIGF